MSYQVLARKWRPQTFADLVGQEHVVRALGNALDQERLHHAYLFTGTRGVGKTTLARILAKALNCEQGVSASPCGQCGSCQEIEQGRFVDLIEVDAASRTGVDDTRELLENVPYAPTLGKFKVYLIDEVHMFSKSSFNALLKTLEEPPPHVKFLLATTDPQKVPVTVLSRCLQFHLKHLTLEQIRARLEYILGEEKIEHDAAALLALARAADGSMRDGLSLLDQAIAYGGGSVTGEDVLGMLGGVGLDAVFELLESIAAGDPKAVLERIHQLSQHTPDMAGVLQELIGLLHRIALAQTVPEAADAGLGDEQQVLELAERMSAEDVQLYYQIALIGRRDLPLAPDPRSGLEMVLLRMLAFRPAGARVAAAQPSTGRIAPAPQGATSKPAADTRPAGQPPASDTGKTAVPIAAADPGWAGIIEKTGVRGMARELAANCRLIGKEGDVVRLQLDAAHAQLQTGNVEDRLRVALEKHYGESVSLEIVVGDSPPGVETPAQTVARKTDERYRQARETIEADSNVKALQEAFSARIVPDLIEPVD